MKHFWKHTLAILLTLALLTGLTACGKKPESTPSSSEPAPSSSETVSTPETDPTLDGSVNPLTGLDENWTEEMAGQFTGIMVANNSIARPQYGITKADWIVVSESEGGITRMMLIFADSTLVPAEVCPVRSARSHFVKIADSLRLNYVHAGGSVKGDEQLKKSTQLTDINALAYDGTTFWRNEDLKKNKGAFLSDENFKNLSDANLDNFCCQIQIKDSLYYSKPWGNNYSINSIATSDMYRDLGIITPPIYKAYKQDALRTRKEYEISQDVRTIKDTVCLLASEVANLSKIQELTRLDGYKWMLLYDMSLRQEFLKFMTLECFEEYVALFLLAELRTDVDMH
ncbi:MAG: DUF3048 domain-containing protein, partial [Clostridia bacterium]|nr:DUF3048 domain-containing protein [Clostridia bacterium]